MGNDRESRVAPSGVPGASRLPEGASDGHAEGDQSDKAGLGSRAPRVVRGSPSLHLAWRIGILVVGGAVIAAGVAMLALPGPGWVAIFAGFALLGTEFVWAQRALRRVKRSASRAATWTLNLRTRRRNLTVLGVGVLVLAALVGGYLAVYGVPYER